MGPYCVYCDNRCFVPRKVPGSPVSLMATCPAGMANDLRATGYTYLTAINPAEKVT